MLAILLNDTFPSATEFDLERIVERRLVKFLERSTAVNIERCLANMDNRTWHYFDPGTDGFTMLDGGVGLPPNDNGAPDL